MMTLGKKIKKARKQAGLSQEQLSEKLNISRSAVAKWETNKGLPDIENLKALAQLLDTSLDYLLDDGKILEKSLIKEAIDLPKYGTGTTKKLKDKVIREKYPTADIYTLISEVKESRSEKIADNVFGFFLDMPFGIPKFLNGIKHLDEEYYLVEQDDKQFLVQVTQEFMTSRELTEKQYDKKFEIGNMRFTNHKVNLK